MQKNNQKITLQTLQSMSIVEYEAFVDSERLSSLDLKGVLWCGVGTHPIATNAEQLESYIDKLQLDFLEMKRLERH
jgi:hypothetical protein